MSDPTNDTRQPVYFLSEGADTSELLDTEQLRERLQMAAAHLNKLIGRRTLPMYIEPGTGMLLFRPEDVEVFEQAREEHRRELAEQFANADENRRKAIEEIADGL